MRQTEPDDARRVLLKTAAAGLGACAAGALGPALAAAAAVDGRAVDMRTDGVPAGPPRPGAPGDFGFLDGEWRIRHRRLKTPGGEDWDAFEGEATCRTILGGVGSVEELRIPARGFAGMGLRLLDLETKVWSDYWVNAKSGALGAAGLTGGFVDGAGVFLAEDVDEGAPIRVRGVWDRIAPGACRWHQAVSRDGGATWRGNWFMEWTRTGPARG